MAAGAQLFDLLGKVDNLNDPIPPLNRRPVAFGLIIVFLIFALLCASARLYVRLWVKKCAWWDDAFVVLSMITGSGLAIAVMVGFNHHSGEHLLNYIAEPGAIVDYAKASYFQNGFYPTAISFIKVAILLQYLRLFQDRRRYQQATIIVLVIVTTWGLASSFICWIPAFPVSALWDYGNTTAVRYGLSSMKPNEFTRTYIVLTSINMALDITVLMIPVPYYASSAMPTRSRYSLVGLFLVGTVINLISLGRLVEIVSTRAGTYPTLDPSFYVTSPMVLSSLEVSLSIMAASMPVFWPMLKFDLGSIVVTTEVTVTQEPFGGTGGDTSGGRSPRSARAPWSWHEAKGAGRWEARVVPMVPLGSRSRAGGPGSQAENDEEALIGPVSCSTPKLKRSLSKSSAYVSTAGRGRE